VGNTGLFLAQNYPEQPKIWITKGPLFCSFVGYDVFCLFRRWGIIVLRNVGNQPAPELYFDITVTTACYIFTALKTFDPIDSVESWEALDLMAQYTREIQ
jgi:hypothetical protein